ncbi:MAG: 50S ribosomal protein L29 [Bacteroidales bacterium]|nr:50S ribosomal protein L29 [Bacteroidales bacterium]
MKPQEIRELTLNEIIERIENEENFITKQKLNHAISPLDNPMKIRASRRNLARLKTILKEKQMQENLQKS